MWSSIRRRCAFITSLTLAAGAASQAQQFTPQVQEFIKVNAPTVALTDAKVIDGTGRPALLHQTVLLHNGRIEQVGP